MRTPFLSRLIVRSSLAALTLAAAPLHAEEGAAPAMTPSPALAAPAKAVPAGDYVAAKVNGQPIKRSEINALLAIAFPGDEKPDYAALEPTLQENVVQNIALERLILAEVQKNNFDKDPTLQQRIEFMRRQITMKTFLEHKAKNAITEAALREEYAKRIKNQEGKEEVHARHILVNTETEANQILARVKKGEDFEKLANEKSKAKSDNGGDLGWFTKDNMFPQLATAAFDLKKGQVSKPIKTDFGWHIVKLEDRRKAAPQTFEQMKGALEIEMRGKAEENYIGKLVQSAKVEMFEPDGKPFTPPAGPAAHGDDAPAGPAGQGGDRPAYVPAAPAKDAPKSN